MAWRDGEAVPDSTLLNRGQPSVRLETIFDLFLSFKNIVKLFLRSRCRWRFPNLTLVFSIRSRSAIVLPNWRWQIATERQPRRLYSTLLIIYLYKLFLDSAGSLETLHSLLPVFRVSLSSLSLTSTTAQWRLTYSTLLAGLRRG